jgi:hypothetical protein
MNIILILFCLIFFGVRAEDGPINAASFSIAINERLFQNGLKAVFDATRDF